MGKSDIDIAQEVDLSGAGADIELELEEGVDLVDPAAIAQPPNEVEALTKTAQDRIDALTAARHKAEREVEARDRVLAERDAELAALRAENMKANTRIKAVDAGMIRSEKDRVTMAKQVQSDKYSAAVNDQDLPKQLAAMQELQRLAVVESQLDRLAATRKTAEEEAAKAETANVAQPVAQEAPAPQVDPAAQEWASRNTWFGQQGFERQTAMAFAIHSELVNEGVDARSRVYYTELEARLGEVYPTLLAPEATAPTPRPQAPRVASAAASASNSRPANGTASRKTIHLTASQLNIAEQLGISPAKYAAQLSKGN